MSVQSNNSLTQDKPVGHHKRIEQWGVSCQAAGCEAYIPSHRAGSLTSQESQKSQVDCNPQGNLDDILTSKH